VNSVELPAPADPSDWRDGRELGLDDDLAVESIRSLGGAISGYQQLLETVETAHASAESGCAVDVDGGRGTAAALMTSLRDEPATLRSLASADPERELAVCRELTKRHEEVARGSARELADRFSEPPKGEITLVLGPAARAEPAAPTTAVEAVTELVDAGVARRQAASVVARLTGLSRKDLYDTSL